jgi:cytochrome c oxidase subunit II
VRRLVLALPAAISAALATAAVAAANNGLSPVTPQSSNAEAIRTTYWVILGVSAVIFVLVETALLVFIFRFRSRGRRRDQEAAQIHGATKLETSFTVVPVLILAGIMAFVFVKLPRIKDVPPANAAGSALKIRVEGHQYYWLFRYPGGEKAVQHMVVPINRVVTLDVVASDVVHSWWVPALGGKIDAIPGRTNHTWFRAEEIGRYEARCAELCGLEHAHMIGYVDVVSAEQYRAFLAAHSGASAQLGKEIFDGTCATCHGLAGQGDYGPKIAGSATIADPNALEDLLRHGKNKMPAVGATWDEDTMEAATTYLKRRFGGGQG